MDVRKDYNIAQKLLPKWLYIFMESIKFILLSDKFKLGRICNECFKTQKFKSDVGKRAS
jgi:hypothetical protein